MLKAAGASCNRQWAGKLEAGGGIWTCGFICCDEQLITICRRESILFCCSKTALTRCGAGSGAYSSKRRLSQMGQLASAAYGGRSLRREREGT